MAVNSVPTEPEAPIRLTPPSPSPGLREQLHEDWMANCGPASRTEMLWRAVSRPGFHAVVVHRFGCWVRDSKPRPKPLWEVLYRMLFTLTRNFYGIELPREVVVGRRLAIGHQGGVVANTAVQIGDDCLIRHNVTLGVYVESRPWEAPKLGANVRVGAGAAILGPIKIGDGAAIGANAVVAKDVPADHVAIAPAAMIKPRRKPRTKLEAHEPPGEDDAPRGPFV